MVINPATPVAVLEEILQDVDQVLGDDGQTRVLDISNFLPTTLPKIRRVREMIEPINSGFDLERRTCPPLAVFCHCLMLARKRSMAVDTNSFSPKTAVPDTRTLAPAAAANGPVSASMPPSTSRYRARPNRFSCRRPGRPAKQSCVPTLRPSSQAKCAECETGRIS